MMVLERTNEGDTFTSSLVSNSSGVSCLYRVNINIGFLQRRNKTIIIPFRTNEPLDSRREADLCDLWIPGGRAISM